MACRQCTRPSPARVAISRIEKAWLREATWPHVACARAAAAEAGGGGGGVPGLVKNYTHAHYL